MERKRRKERRKERKKRERERERERQRERKKERDREGRGQYRMKTRPLKLFSKKTIIKILAHLVISC